MKRDPQKLTKADTVALWHAVTTFDLCVRTMKGMDFKPEQIAAERARVALAKQSANGWTAACGMLKLCVHRHIHHPGSWCVSCEPFWSARPLISEALADAKEEARGMLQRALHDAQEGLR